MNLVRLVNMSTTKVGREDSPNEFPEKKTILFPCHMKQQIVKSSWLCFALLEKEKRSGKRSVNCNYQLWQSPVPANQDVAVDLNFVCAFPGSYFHLISSVLLQRSHTSAGIYFLEEMEMDKHLFISWKIIELPHCSASICTKTSCHCPGLCAVIWSTGRAHLMSCFKTLGTNRSLVCRAVLNLSCKSILFLSRTGCDCDIVNTCWEFATRFGHKGQALRHRHRRAAGNNTLMGGGVNMGGRDQRSRNAWTAVCSNTTTLPLKQETTPQRSGRPVGSPGKSVGSWEILSETFFFAENTEE